MHLNKKRTSRPIFDLKELGVVALFISLALIMDLSLNRLLAEDERVKQESLVTSKLSAIRAQVEKRLNTNLYLIYSMAAIISIRPDISSHDFETIGKDLISRGVYLRNVAMAPDFVIKDVYPRKGNETMIGVDYRRLPDQWEQALAAKESGRMIVAGPLNLVQGGMGIVARMPVFEHENGRFWGLVSAVMDFNELVRRGELEADAKDLDIAIRGKDGKGEKGETFWGTPEIFDKRDEVIHMPITLPTGFWQIAARPKEGWRVSFSHQWLVHTIVLIISISGCFVSINQHRNRLRLIENEDRVKSMSKASHDALIMVNSIGNITFWNPAAEEMFGYSEAEALGKDLHHLITKPVDAEKAYTGLLEFAKTGQGPVMSRVIEMVAVRKSGEVFAVERSVAPFRFQGEWYAVGSVRDITARKQFEKRLKEMATTDELTGLYNRRYFMETAESQIKQAIRYQRPFSMMMFDLDHFKRINDTFGHDAGDRVLQAAAKVMQEIFRSVDLIGRIGGEEFAVAMPETDLDMAKKAGERLRDSLMQARVKIRDESIRFTASIGITHLTSPQTTLAQMLKQADESLYRAKNEGRNRVVVTA